MRFLRITLANHEEKYFASVGGAGFQDEREWLEEWDAVPAHDYPDDAPWELLLDRMPDEVVIDRFKTISMDTACALLGISEPEVFERAAADHERSVRELDALMQLFERRGC